MRVLPGSEPATFWFIWKRQERNDYKKIQLIAQQYMSLEYVLVNDHTGKKQKILKNVEEKWVRNIIF